MSHHQTVEELGGVAAHPPYPKIMSLWKRDPDNQNRVIPGAWATETLAQLQDMPWIFTEKVDGTNVRLGWIKYHGRESHFIGGRTDKAIMPKPLLAVLEQLQGRMEYEFAFPTLEHGTPVTLYGEGYGAGIQSGGHYRPDPSFVLFDVKVGPHWLSWDNVQDVADKLQIECVPMFQVTTMADVWDMLDPRRGARESLQWPGSRVEGYVGRPRATLYDGRHERVTCKVKAVDRAHEQS